MKFERFLGDGLDMFCIVVEVSYVAMSDVRARGLVFTSRCVSWIEGISRMIPAICLLESYFE